MLANNSEKDLLELVANGDENAFKNLFFSYHQKLGGYIYRLTNSWETSQEIVQDTFLKIWANRAALTEIQNFNSYLFTVARNHTFNVLKQMARTKLQKKAWEAGQEDDLKVLENDVIGYKEFAALVSTAIEQLPPRQKEVFQLSRNNGFTHEQIAEQLGVSLETVKKHMVLALKAIRTYLSNNAISVIVLCALLMR